jgi:sterol desaturase/sphingolipid hydroxylase (fatty acid hydroxylase superfamily)
MMLAIFGAVALVFFVAERLIPRRAQPMVRRGIVADVLYVPIHYGLRVAVSFLLADAVTELARRWLPGGRGLVSGLPIVAQAVMVLVVLDFLFYVMHRLKHRFHWLWRLHETHHSSPELDFLASVRFHPLEKLLDRFVYLLPLALFGAHPTALVIWSAVDVFFGMMNHSNARVRLGPLSYVLVGPELHLRHHSSDPAHRDSNFGNNLSVFDWMFGTANVTGDEPQEFGLAEDRAVYPHENIVRQWVFAFRPRSEQASRERPAALGRAVERVGFHAAAAAFDGDAGDTHGRVQFPHATSADDDAQPKVERRRVEGDR